MIFEPEPELESTTEEDAADGTATADDANATENESCAICLSDFKSTDNVIKLNCGHICMKIVLKHGQSKAQDPYVPFTEVNSNTTPAQHMVHY